MQNILKLGLPASSQITIIMQYSPLSPALWFLGHIWKFLQSKRWTAGLPQTQHCLLPIWWTKGSVPLGELCHWILYKKDGKKIKCWKVGRLKDFSICRCHHHYAQVTHGKELKGQINQLLYLYREIKTWLNWLKANQQIHFSCNIIILAITAQDGKYLSTLKAIVTFFL